jgi:peptidoglycan hydrolase-like protein with peptidoglycan-binding domain
MMRQTVWRWLWVAGGVTAVGVLALGQGMAGASTAFPTGGHFPSTVKVRPATGPYKPPSQPLYVGETGPAVKNVQRRLNALHYYAGPVDGSFGQDLLWAAWAFRAVNGMPVNSTTAAEPISRNFERALVHPKLPPVLVPKGGANRVEINQKLQIAVVYKDNKVEWIWRISSGGGYYYCNPPSGGGGCGYAVTIDGNFHAEYMISGLDIVPLGSMFNPVFFDPAAGQAMHGGDPVPFYPASHGCVRLQLDVENWFFKYLTIGGKHPEPVYVRGVAPYLN